MQHRSRAVTSHSLSITLLLALPAVAGCQTGPQVLTQAPGPGRLRPGETVLVDDGSCPAGQVKQVVGGSDRVYMTDTPRPGAPRQTSCVPRAQ